MWWKRKLEDRIRKELTKLLTDRNEACARERAAKERLEAVEREHFRTQHKLTTVTEVAGEMASKRLVLERDLALVKAQLKTAMSLLETVRSVPELVVEIANEGRMEHMVYDRAEKCGISREVESVQQVHAILLAMKSSRVVADARERLLLERLRLRDESSEEVSRCVAVLGTEEDDTKKVKVDGMHD